MSLMITRTRIINSGAGEYIASARNTRYGIHRKVEKLDTVRKARLEAIRLFAEVEEACDARRGATKGPFEPVSFWYDVGTKRPAAKPHYPDYVVGPVFITSETRWLFECRSVGCFHRRWASRLIRSGVKKIRAMEAAHVPRDPFELVETGLSARVGTGLFARARNNRLCQGHRTQH